jgi:uncharacterized RDD family membrane protein YckC
MHVASTWKRIWARLIDQVLLGFIIVPLIWFFPAADGWMYMPVTSFLGISVIPLVYESAFYYLMNATPGKWIFGLKVVPVNDGKHWGGRVLLRASSLYFTLFFSWALYLTALYRLDRRHVFDLLAETKVVSQDHAAKMKLHPIFASILIVIGVTTGLAEARYRFGMISLEQGRVKFPDPFDFSNMVPSQ